MWMSRQGRVCPGSVPLQTLHSLRSWRDFTPWQGRRFYLWVCLPRPVGGSITMTCLLSLPLRSLDVLSRISSFIAWEINLSHAHQDFWKNTRKGALLHFSRPPWSSLRRSSSKNVSYWILSGFERSLLKTPGHVLCEHGWRMMRSQILAKAAKQVNRAHTLSELLPDHFPLDTLSLPQVLSTLVNSGIKVTLRRNCRNH